MTAKQTSPILEYIAKASNVEQVTISRNVLAIKITKSYQNQKHNILLIGIYVLASDSANQRKQYTEMINMFINNQKDDYDQIIVVGDFNTGFIYFLDKVPVC